MSTDKTDAQAAAAPLPSFPEAVEAFMASADSADPPIALILSRRTATRWQRVASLTPGDDRYDNMLGHVSRHTVEHGATTWQLVRPDTEAVSWISTAAIDDSSDVPAMNFADPNDVVRASWELTFRSARMMIDTTSIAPRLVREVASVYREALATLREVTGTGEAATLAAVQADASSKKLDKIFGVLEKVAGVDERGKKAVTAGNKGDGAIAFAGRLLRAATKEDRESMLDHELGRALAIVDDMPTLKKLVDRLWAAHSSGDLKLSQTTLDAARAVVKELNP